ncbi:MAG: ribosome silencing factor [Phycisphaera sp.]|nr:MAG: ribosome silencing factor [Phycisphaera sp.]
MDPHQPMQPNDANAQPIKLDTQSATRRGSTDDARVMAIDLARALTDDKCENVLVLDVSGVSPVTDYIVIASGTSDRQMNSVLDNAMELAEEAGMAAVRHAKDERATWLLADFVDVMLHIFEPNTRAHYDVESLYPDATEVAWARPDQIDRNRAGLKPDERFPQ